MLAVERTVSPEPMLKEMPLLMVRSNQTMLILGCLLAIILQNPYIVLALFVIAAASLLIGPGVNPAFFAARYLLGVRRLYYSKTESAVTQRFNQIIAVCSLGLASVFLFTAPHLLGWLFVAFVIVAATSALAGFCIGCILYFRIKMWTMGKQDPWILRMLAFFAGSGPFKPRVQMPNQPIALIAIAHHSIRAHIAELLEEADQVGPDTFAYFARDARDFERCLEFHATQENLALYPAVIAKRPGHIEGLYDEHTEDIDLAHSMLAAIDKACADPAAIPRAVEAVRDWCAFNIKHLHHEEAIVMPLVASSFTHEEALEVARKILAVDQNEYIQFHLGYIFSKLDPGQKFNYASILREVATPEEFKQYSAVAQPLVTSSNWTAFLGKPASA